MLSTIYKIIYITLECIKYNDETKRNFLTFLCLHLIISVHFSSKCSTGAEKGTKGERKTKTYDARIQFEVSSSL